MKTTAKLILMLMGLSFLGCSSEDETQTPPPNPAQLTVSTDTPSGITQTLVTLGGKIVTPGTEPILQTGICLSIDPNPTIDDPEDFYGEIERNGDQFSDTYNGMPAGLVIHVRAYAKTASAVVYGEDKTFEMLGGCLVEAVNPDETAVTITSPTVWTSDRVYVITHDVTVNSTLTIEPGTIVKIWNAQLRVNSGSIIANGTSENRIVFTSLADDSYCGDTNADATATLPQKGNWIGLYLNGGNNSFQYCDFLYAGASDGGYNNAVNISVAGIQFDFDHCVFAHTLSSGNSTAFTFHGGSYMQDPAVSKFTNNAFYDNDRPIFLNSYYSLPTSNIFHNPSDASQKNARNGIWLYNTTMQDATVNWNISEVPYVVTAFFNGGGSGATDTVNIGANVIVKFAGASAGIARSASRQVNLNGTAVLTSFKDDARGGDTNGDGNSTAPAAGDWDGFYNYINTSYIGAGNIFYAAH